MVQTNKRVPVLSHESCSPKSRIIKTAAAIRVAGIYQARTTDQHRANVGTVTFAPHGKLRQHLLFASSFTSVKIEAKTVK